MTLSFIPGPGVTSFGSLVNGEYQLAISADRISSQGVALDGNDDGSAGGDFVFGAESTDNFFRRYGDVNGNRSVDLLDFSQFRLSFGSGIGDSAFQAGFDVDGDDLIGLLDFSQFRDSFGN